MTSSIIPDDQFLNNQSIIKSHTITKTNGYIGSKHIFQKYHTNQIYKQHLIYKSFIKACFI